MHCAQRLTQLRCNLAMRLAMKVGHLDHPALLLWQAGDGCPHLLAGNIVERMRDHIGILIFNFPFALVRVDLDHRVGDVLALRIDGQPVNDGQQP